MPKKSASESAGPKRGAEESAEKVLRGPSLFRKLVQARRPEALFSAVCSAPRLGPALSEALFSAPFPGWGFGTSLDGRQARDFTAQITIEKKWITY